MDEWRNKNYHKINNLNIQNENKKNNSNEVLKLVTISKPKPGKQTNLTKPKKDKKSALELSNSISVTGAFGYTLTDLYRQGR